MKTPILLFITLVVLAGTAHASAVLDGGCINTKLGSAWVVEGVYVLESDAKAARDAYTSSSSNFSNSGKATFSVADGRACVSPPQTGNLGISYYFYAWSGQYHIYIYGYAPYVEDSDGDGIPDDQDLYPDDPTPYLMKLVGYYTEDGTPGGVHTFEIWKTDRPGDYFKVGEEPDDINSGFYIRDGTWIDPTDGTGPSMGNATPSDGPEIDDPVYSTGAPTGDAPQDQEGTGKGGTASTGTETDTQSLHGIMTNTGNIADNTKRQLDYLKDLNKSIQTMDRNLARMGGGGVLLLNGSGDGDGEGEQGLIEKLDEDRTTDQAASDTAKTALENFDVQAALGENINGELVEGEDGDYQKPGDLIEETWVQEALNNNPIKTTLSNSGFSYGSSSATATLDLGYLGHHTLDIRPLEPGFILFGNLLVGMVTLAGLVYVATGRGF
ncbi:MAG: hypothetical protein V6Z89_14420 [Desulfobacter sp.]